MFAHNCQVYFTEGPSPSFADDVFIPPTFKVLNKFTTFRQWNEQSSAAKLVTQRIYFDTIHPTNRGFRFDDLYRDGAWTDFGMNELRSWADTFINVFSRPLIEAGVSVEAIMFDHARFTVDEARRHEQAFKDEIANVFLMPIVEAFPGAHIGMYGIDTGFRPSRTLAWNPHDHRAVIDIITESPFTTDPREHTAWIRGYGRPGGQGGFPGDAKADFKRSLDSVFGRVPAVRPGACVIWTPRSQMTPTDWSRMLVILCERFGWPLVPQRVPHTAAQVVADIVNRFDRDGSIEPGDTMMSDLLHTLARLERSASGD